MNIVAFARELERRVRTGPSPRASIRTESEFEHEYVVKPAWELHLAHPEITVCAHPADPRAACEGGCGTATARAKGCPKCWHACKAWSVVRAYGLKHTFDLVARDRKGDTLAVEVKWLSFEGRRGPNGGFQRFIGQCTLAAARHKVVIGICGVRGRPTNVPLAEEQERELRRTLAAIGVRLVVLSAPEVWSGRRGSRVTRAGTPRAKEG